jgi:YHS domain-containing protein
MRKISTALAATAMFLLLTCGVALAHGGHPHLMGTVTAVAADHLEVKTKDGKAVSVPLAKTTRYSKGDQKATPADVHAGDRVVVHLGAGGAAEEVILADGKSGKGSMGGMDHGDMGGMDGMDHGTMGEMKGMDHGTMGNMSGMDHSGMGGMDAKATAQVTDPVCGMKVADAKTAPRSIYAGKAYYFCSQEDKAKFDKDPETYLKKAS